MLNLIFVYKWLRFVCFVHYTKGTGRFCLGYFGYHVVTSATTLLLRLPKRACRHHRWSGDGWSASGLPAISQVESARAEAQSPWFFGTGVQKKVREEATRSADAVSASNRRRTAWICSTLSRLWGAIIPSGCERGRRQRR